MGVESAVGMPKAVSLALRPLRKSANATQLDETIRQVKRGSTIADALTSSRLAFPPFVLDAIRAGEETGRLSESLRFVERHCDLLAGPAKTLRNTWLLPLCLFLGGDVISVGIILALGSFQEATSFGWRALWGWFCFFTLVWVVLLPALRPLVDRFRLSLPFAGSIERDIARHRFFRIMSLLWGVSDQRVEKVIELAAGTIPNLASREDLLRAADGVRRKLSVAEAFELPELVLDQNAKDWIAGGELAGKLEETFDHLADASAESLERKLKAFNAIATRLVTAVVAFSVISVVLQFVSRVAAR